MDGVLSPTQVSWIFGGLAVVLVVVLLAAGWSLRHWWLGPRPPWRLLVVLSAVYCVVPPAMGALQPALGPRGAGALFLVAMAGAVLGWVGVGVLWLRDRRTT